MANLNINPVHEFDRLETEVMRNKKDGYILREHEGVCAACGSHVRNKDCYVTAQAEYTRGYKREDL